MTKLRVEHKFEKFKKSYQLSSVKTQINNLLFNTDNKILIFILKSLFIQNFIQKLTKSKKYFKTIFDETIGLLNDGPKTTEDVFFNSW